MGGEGRYSRVLKKARRKKSGKKWALSPEKQRIGEVGGGEGRGFKEEGRDKELSGKKRGGGIEGISQQVGASEPNRSIEGS